MALLLLVGCTEPPSVVSTTVSVPDTETSTNSTTESGPTSTTEGPATAGSADGTATSTTGDPATTMPLDGTSTSESTTETTVDPSATSGSSGDPTTGGMESSSGGLPDCHPMLAEVYYDPDTTDDEEQWVKLYNDCGFNIDLSNYSLGWAGPDYTYGNVDLMGTINDGQCFIVGGPMSIPQNEMPNLGYPVDFNPNMQKGGNPGKGVALFDIAAASIMPDTVPVDAVIHGNNNASNLLDATGMAPANAHTGNVGNGKSIRRTAVAGPTWVEADPPVPDLCPPF